MPEPVHSEPLATLYQGDCVEVMAALPAASVDAIVCDPPYAFEGGFMGRPWDRFETREAFERWTETWGRAALRVLKPGGHALVFGGTRSSHRVTSGLEDAGFQVRDVLMWLYGSGFPKSLDVSKAIDKARDDSADKWAVADFLRPHVERVGFDIVTAHFGFKDETMARARWTSRSQTNTPTWEQWTALKFLCGFSDEMDAEVWRLNGRKGTPGQAWETADVLAEDVRYNEPSGIVNVGQGPRTPVIREIKSPNSDAARQWQGWGTGLKPAWEPVILCRRPLAERNVAANVLAHGTGALNIDGCRLATSEKWTGRELPNAKDGVTWGGVLNSSSSSSHPMGRWPANLLLSHTPECVERGCVPECPVRLLDAQSGELTSGARSGHRAAPKTKNAYGAFALRDERPFSASCGGASRFFYTAKADKEDRDGSRHPTLKPVDLMKYLITLVTPPGGIVLDPFAGSGTTIYAARALGIKSIGIDREPEYVQDAIRRLRQGVLL